MVVMSVAIGRSHLQGSWVPTMGMHYGFLSVLIPILSWILVSKFLRSEARALIGLVLAGIFFVSFKENSDWRFSQIPYQVARQEEVVKALQSGLDAETLADKYMLDFSMNKPDTVHAIAGINALRAAGISLYGGHD
jgi:hypothetical protein